MGLNLEIKIGKTKFKNPVLVASGTFGYGQEFEKWVHLKNLGGIITKTLTLKPRLGNPAPRIIETPSGMLNAIGLQNVGAERFVKEKLPFLRKTKVPLITSVMGYSVKEFEEVVSFLDKVEGIDGFELNLSCPNVSYGSKTTKSKARMFAHDAKLISKVVSSIRKKTKKTLIAKLGPDVSDIAGMAIAAEKAGADGISLVNTFTAMAIDIYKRKPILANKTGGLSGPCIRPIAVRMVWEVAKSVKIPVIGIGGIMNTENALEFLVAGASVIQIGTANFTNPSVSMEILDGIKDFMKKEKISHLKQLIGSVKG